MNLLQELSLGNCPRGSLHCAFNASVDGDGDDDEGGCPVVPGNNSESGAYVVPGTDVVAGSPGDSELGLYKSVADASVGCPVLGGTASPAG